MPSSATLRAPLYTRLDNLGDDLKTCLAKTYIAFLVRELVTMKEIAADLIRAVEHIFKVQIVGNVAVLAISVIENPGFFD